ncbi:unnamed protein product [Urochloa humidicola]
MVRRRGPCPVLPLTTDPPPFPSTDPGGQIRAGPRPPATERRRGPRRAWIWLERHENWEACAAIKGTVAWLAIRLCSPAEDIAWGCLAFIRCCDWIADGNR